MLHTHVVALLLFLLLPLLCVLLIGTHASSSCSFKSGWSGKVALWKVLGYRGSGCGSGSDSGCSPESETVCECH